MVPSAVVFVDEWPLTPTGKVDRRLLPPPDFANVRAPSRPPETPDEMRLCRLFSEALAVDRVGVDDNFFALGGDSLRAIRLINLARHAGRPLRLPDVIRHQTVRALARAARMDGSSGHDFDRILPLRPEGNLPPLFCLPPAGGLSWSYIGLPGTLHPARPVYGLQAAGIVDDTPFPETMHAAAAEYEALVRQVQPTGAYHLLGWSFGGLLAHTVACRLQRAGEQVALLAILDAYPYIDVAAPEAVEPFEELERFFKDFEQRSTAYLRAAEAHRMACLVRHNSQLRLAFQPATFDGDILVFAATENLTLCDSWARCASGAVRWFEVAPTHDDMTRAEPTAAIGREVESYLRLARPTGASTAATSGNR
jgi:thioesterase domain-containing protein/aryl carrier-like protein